MQCFTISWGAHGFTHSLLYTLQNVSVLRLYKRINDSGLFAWFIFSLTALSR